MAGQGFRSFPTKYNHVQFRSRLEARWAAFFDLAKWKWEYEPSDDGDWTPDFILRDEGGPTAVEVKPIEWPDELSDCFGAVRARPDLEKVRKSARVRKLVLGAYLPGVFGGDHGMPVIGMIYGENSLGLAFVRSHRYDERSAQFWLMDRPEDYPTKAPASWVEQIWDEAGNRVQWAARGY